MESALICSNPLHLQIQIPNPSSNPNFLTTTCIQRVNELQRAINPLGAGREEVNNPNFCNLQRVIRGDYRLVLGRALVCQLVWYFEALRTLSQFLDLLTGQPEISIKVFM